MTLKSNEAPEGRPRDLLDQILLSKGLRPAERRAIRLYLALGSRQAVTACLGRSENTVKASLRTALKRLGCRTLGDLFRRVLLEFNPIDVEKERVLRRA